MDWFWDSIAGLGQTVNRVGGDFLDAIGLDWWNTGEEDSLRRATGSKNIDDIEKAGILQNALGEEERKSGITKIWEDLFNLEGSRNRDFLESVGKQQIAESKSKVRKENEGRRKDEDKRAGAFRKQQEDELERYADQRDKFEEQALKLKAEEAKSQADAQKSLDEFKQMFKQRLGLADTYREAGLQQAQEYSQSPSVVDALIENAFKQSLQKTAQSYAGRTGGGYLEDFQNKSALADQALIDAGAGKRLAEEQAKKQVLIDSLFKAGSGATQSAQSLPFGLIDRQRDISLGGYKALMDSLNFQQNQLGADRNLLNSLFAWGKGEQDIGLKEQGQYHGQNIDWLNQNRQDRTEQRQNEATSWNKNKYLWEQGKSTIEGNKKAITNWLTG